MVYWLNHPDQLKKRHDHELRKFQLFPTFSVLMTGIFQSFRGRLTLLVCVLFLDKEGAFMQAICAKLDRGVKLTPKDWRDLSSPPQVTQIHLLGKYDDMMEDLKKRRPKEGKL